MAQTDRISHGHHGEEWAVGSEGLTPPSVCPRPQPTPTPPESPEVAHTSHTEASSPVVGLEHGGPLASKGSALLLEYFHQTVTTLPASDRVHYDVSICGCGCWFCPDCCVVKGYKLRSRLVPVLETFTGVMMLTLTVDPSLFVSPLAAYRYMRERRCIARTMQDLRRGAYRHIYSDRYFYVTEWQRRTEQVHYHVLIDAGFVPWHELLASWSKHRPLDAGPVVGDRHVNGKTVEHILRDDLADFQATWQPDDDQIESRADARDLYRRRFAYRCLCNGDRAKEDGHVFGFGGPGVPSLPVERVSFVPVPMVIPGHEGGVPPGGAPPVPPTGFPGGVSPAVVVAVGGLRCFPCISVFSLSLWKISKTHSVSVTILLLSPAVAVFSLLGCILLASSIQDLRGVPEPRDFDPVIWASIFIGLALAVVVLIVGILLAVVVWRRGIRRPRHGHCRAVWIQLARNRTRK